jgi:phytoene synthase
LRKTSFYYSFLVLPKRKRDVIISVWDFCHAVDDSVDLEPDPAKAQRALDGWREEVARVFTHRSPDTPQGRTLQKYVVSSHLPREQFEALVDGVGMDVNTRRFQTFDDLESYCHKVASSVGLVCAEIFQYRDPAVLDYARELGVALQLTNILRDVAVDYARDRLYLPLDDFERFGCSEEDIRDEIAHAAGSGVRSPKVRALLEHQAARARIFYSRATRALPREELMAVLPAEIMREIYTDVLRRIEDRGCDVFSGIVRASRAAQAIVALRAWARIRRGRSARR